MTIRIDTKVEAPPTGPRQAIGGGASVKSALGASGDSGGKSVAAVAATDSVQLSGDAVRLQQFEKTLNATPSTDRSRVDRIRQAITDGSYKVDPQAIASKLVRAEFDLS